MVRLNDNQIGRFPTTNKSRFKIYQLVAFMLISDFYTKKETDNGSKKKRKTEMYAAEDLDTVSGSSEVVNLYEGKFL